MIELLDSQVFCLIEFPRNCLKRMTEAPLVEEALIKDLSMTSLEMV